MAIINFKPKVPAAAPSPIPPGGGLQKLGIGNPFAGNTGALGSVPRAFGAAAGAAGRVPHPAETPTTSTNASDLINSQYENDYNSQLQALLKARDTQLQGLAGQETQANQGAYDNRNSNDLMAAMSMKALKEQMASQGINGGDSITAQIGNDTARQNGANAINRDLANTLQSIAGQRALINNNAAADELALKQQLQAQRDGRLIDQGNTDKNLALQESQVTGYYQSPEMAKQYAIVNQAKQDFANAKTPEERIAAHKRADDARAEITRLGGNAGLVGADVTADQASGNKGKYGIETMAHQQQIWDQNHTTDREKVADDQWEKTFDFNNKVTMANLTGMIDGKPTDAKQQQELQNLWTVAGQTGVIPDKLADMYGLKHGMKTQAAYQFAKGLAIDWYNSQTSRMNANTNQDSNDLAWIEAANKQDGSGNPAKYDGFTPNQVLEAVKGQLFDQWGEPKTGKLDKKAVYDTVMSYGLPIGQDDQVLLSLGLSKADIAALDKDAFGAGK
jgi:hypothetical protein